ncbi:MAG: chromosomal replication initiator protein DnaA [Candidatus Acidulodesulfobacterium ferriphilum]|uniref:Chromosomal replication initiator protein DnaA n=1 Tax=Candidatus Acidulodesulfobacterium ferriphilum TaxID=2597223 RepID=A0A519BDR5_9DELT|nr:MAG: chromosomal replication initiator protein DnaA [Candidatus Acidulodesulfobacterium ferriphilum]
MDFVEPLLEELRKEIGSNNFNIWFIPANITLNKNTITFSVPNKFFKDIINESYKDIILNIWKKLNNNDELNFIYDINDENGYDIKNYYQNLIKLDNNKINQEENNGCLTRVSLTAQPDTENKPANKKNPKKNYINLNPKYTFENFVIGSGNQFAHAASFAVANLPGQTYNPMFIYSDVGLGKTHLLNAIANKILKEKDLNICLVSSEKFTNEMITSIRDDKMVEFRNKYRNVDVLLIDDIQFIAGKERTQEEFFYTFNSLYENQKQIVVSSDKIPRDIISLEERIRSRFEWGLIADIQPPDFETRIAILKKKAFLNNIDFPDDVLNLLADKINSNIRELEGAMIKIAAFSSFTGKPISIDLAREATLNILKEEEKVITAEAVIKVVCNYFNIKICDIKSNKKLKEFVVPRQLAMYLIRNHTNLSFPEIGDKFGGKDHSSIVYAVNKVKKMLKNNDELEKTLDTIIKIIKK